MTKRIALTGGIASGKSSVADLLAERGAVIIDSDVSAREVVEPGTPGLAAIVERFGEGVLRDDGALDRPALGAIVFADPAARADLEAITHPRIRARADALRVAAPEGAVVIDVIPLLVEVGLAGRFDEVIVVDVPEEVQVERLRRRTASRATRRWPAWPPRRPATTGSPWPTTWSTTPAPGPSSRRPSTRCGAASPPPDASGVLAQHDLHAAVLGLAGVVGVRRHRPVEPEALHGHARRRDALAGQRVRDRLGTALGQVLVLLGAAVGVGVALDGDLRPVEVGQQLRDLGELGRRGGLDTFEVQV